MATIDSERVRTRTDRAGTRRAGPTELAAVAAGGVLGTLARCGLSRLAPVPAGHFPWTTFAINATGSFALGLVVALAAGRFPDRRLLRPFAASGFLGAYTTYSTFVVEADRLAGAGHVPGALAYVVASVAAGAVAAGLGLRLGQPAR